MKSIKNDLQRFIYPLIEGYEFVKMEYLYIPVRELGIEALVRKEIPLSLAFEMILKLVDKKCYDIDKMEKILGIENNVLYDIVGEMSNTDLVYLKSGQLIITEKGKLALGALRRISIEKTQIRNIYFNLITGKSMHLKDERLVKRPFLYLHEEYSLDYDFLEKKFAEINSYYIESQNSMPNGLNSLNNELYKILRITNDKLSYFPCQIFIYYNDYDKEFKYYCPDENGDLYISAYKKQIKNKPGARNNLKSCRDVARYLPERFVCNQVKMDITDSLRSAIISKTSTQEEIERLYFSERYLFEGEYRSILSDLKSIRPKEIYVVTDCLNNLFNDDYIKSSILGVAANTQIHIVYSNDEYQVEKLVQHINKVTSPHRKNVHLYSQEGIINTKVLLYPYCLIDIENRPINFDSYYLIKEVSTITFSPNDMNRYKNIIEKEYLFQSIR